MISLGIVVTEAFLDEAHLSGYDYCELSGRSLAALSDGAFRALVKRVARSGLQVRAMNAYCPPEIRIAGPGFELKKARAYAKGLAVRAEALGIRVTGVGSPNSRNLPPDYDRETADRETIEFLACAAEEMEKRNVTVLLEPLAPCFCNYINTLKEAAVLARRAGVGIVADFYNMEHSGEGDTDVSPYIGLIGHAHISDDDGDPLKRSYCDPAKAPVHRRRVRRLLEAGYQGALTLEIDTAYDEARARDTLHMLVEAVKYKPI